MITAARPDDAPAPVAWSESQYRRFGLDTQITEHGYHEWPMFEDAALVARGLAAGRRTAGHVGSRDAARRAQRSPQDHLDRAVTKRVPVAELPETWEAFHRSVMERFAARDEPWLVTLELDGGIIGVMYLYRWRDELMIFQSGFAPEHEALSPGHVMFEWVFREGIRRGLRRADMLKGEYHYKTAWARSETFLRDHAFHRAGPAAWLVALRRRFGRLDAGGTAPAPRAPDDRTRSA